MAKTKNESGKNFLEKVKKKIGRHSKKDSNTKSSKNYKKPNAGQGR
jgi:hypothetical protein